MLNTKFSVYKHVSKWTRMPHRLSDGYVKSTGETTIDNYTTVLGNCSPENSYKRDCILFFRSKKNLQWKLLSRILFNFVPSWPSVVIGLVNFFLKLEKMHRKCILWSILFHRRWPQRNPNLKIPTVSVFKICEIKHFKKVLPKRFPKVWNLVKNGSWGPQNSPKLRWQS